MSLHPAHWQLIGTTATPTIGIVLSYLTPTKNRNQLIQHDSARFDMQRLTTARSVSTSIAEKRRKWTGHLRIDLSQYPGLTTALSDRWKRLFWKTAGEWDGSRPSVGRRSSPTRRDVVLMYHPSANPALRAIMALRQVTNCIYRGQTASID